ncbi:hypothetical protein SKAU_G00188940 [Synaphobranchus kaupii]|uniref:Uncharacterized protein n=1 Tax=Synaphobranchus kaupii TaxID=118154 RepID=A0A9Q1FD23_SYNKA|nr:hypothetical protein SKAU_G00188940 [Synaphobranchus kaupii]
MVPFERMSRGSIRNRRHRYEGRLRRDTALGVQQRPHYRFLRNPRARVGHVSHMHADTPDNGAPLLVRRVPTESERGAGRRGQPVRQLASDSDVSSEGCQA